MLRIQSRKNTISVNVILCAVLFALLLACCSEPPTFIIPEPFLSGTVEGYVPLGSDTLLDFWVGGQRLTQTAISSSGHFALYNPLPAPGDSVLSAYVPRSDSNSYWRMTEHLAFSDSSAKYASVIMTLYTQHLIGYELYSGNNYLISDSGAAVGDFTMKYYYFDRPTHVTGATTWILTDSLMERSFGHWEYTNFDLNVKAGWNPVMTMITSTDSLRRVFSVTVRKRPDARWFPGWVISRNFELSSNL